MLEAGGFPQEIALGGQVSVRLPPDRLVDRLLPVRNPQVGDARPGGIVTLPEQLGLHLIANGTGFSLTAPVLGPQRVYHPQEIGFSSASGHDVFPGCAVGCWSVSSCRGTFIILFSFFSSADCAWETYVHLRVGLGL